jgi:hypothetical protein
LSSGLASKEQGKVLPCDLRVVEERWWTKDIEQAVIRRGDVSVLSRRWTAVRQLAVVRMWGQRAGARTTECADAR